MSTGVEQDERLRPHPESRFALPQIQVDLPSVIARLRSEPHTGEGGHRQETVYKGHGLTVAVFAFDRFTGLPAHRAKGVVNMHVLRGKLKITAENEVHEIGAGQMLIVAPEVEHAVSAEEESEMLVTVNLRG